MPVPHVNSVLSVGSASVSVPQTQPDPSSRVGGPASWYLSAKNRKKIGYSVNNCDGCSERRGSSQWMLQWRTPSGDEAVVAFLCGHCELAAHFFSKLLMPCGPNAYLASVMPLPDP